MNPEEDKPHIGSSGRCQGSTDRDGRFSGTQLSEEQARSVIGHMTDVLPVEISEIYNMGSVIERARNRAVEAFGSR